MSKIKSEAVRLNAGLSTKTIAGCALLAALSVILARLIIPMPNEYTRFSIEAVPIFLAGMLFGPLAGGLVGFVADTIGALISGFGYNPFFCLPPILYGLCGGLFRPLLAGKVSLPRLAAAFAPAVIFGSILYQSATLAYFYGREAFWLTYITRLWTRSIQFAITMVIDVVVVWLLSRSGVFTAIGLWPPKKKK